MCGRPNLYTQLRVRDARSSRRGRSASLDHAARRRSLSCCRSPAGHQPDPGRAVPRRRRLDPAHDQAVIFAIAALGLNMLTGVAGQVSLGHAFFMGVGAYTAVVARRRARRTTCGASACRSGSGCPGAGIGAALVGHHRRRRPRCGSAGSTSASSPSAWSSSGSTCRSVFPEISGGAEVGRDFPPLDFRLWKEEEPLIDFTDDGHWLWFDISGTPKTYLFCLGVLLVGLARGAKNIVRTRTGRALAGDPRPRRRRRGDGRPGGQVQADRVRHLVVLRRGRRARCSPPSSGSSRPSTGT